MHRVNRLIVGFGLVFFIVAITELFIYKEQPVVSTGIRFRSIDQGFEITEVEPYTYCGELGVHKNQIITKINNIDAASFVESHGKGSNTDSYVYYSKIFQEGKSYRIEFSDGSFVSFVNKKASFWKRFIQIPLLEKVLFLVGVIFIFFGFVSALVEKEKAKTSSFIWFMYSAGLAIINSYVRATNTYFYTLVNTILFDVACTIVISSLCSCVIYFYKLVPKYQNRTKCLSIVRWIPFGVIAIKFIWMSFNKNTLFDLPMNMLAQIMFVITCIYMIIFFIRVTKKIPDSSSVLLRFFLLSTLFALLPAMNLLLPNLLKLNYWLTFVDIMYAIIPLIFIPVSLTCALILSNHIEFYKLCYHVITYGVSLIICLLCSLMMYQAGKDWRNISFLLVFISPCFCALLEKPIENFLFPKIKNLKTSLYELETVAVLEKNMEDVYDLLSRWYIENMNIEFIAFYNLESGEQKREIYSVFCDDKKRSELMFMSRERYNHPALNRNFMQHKNGGYSLPIKENKKLIGYVYVGSKKNGSYFSPYEIDYLYSVLEILSLTKKIIQNTKSENIEEVE